MDSVGGVVFLCTRAYPKPRLPSFPYVRRSNCLWDSGYLLYLCTIISMCMHLHITVTMPLAVKSAASVVVDNADRRAWANCREAWKNRSGAINMADVDSCPQARR